MPLLMKQLKSCKRKVERILQRTKVTFGAMGSAFLNEKARTALCCGTVVFVLSIIEIHRYVSTFCYFYFCQICTAEPIFKLLILGRKSSSNLLAWDIEVESTCYRGDKKAKGRCYGGTERLHTGHSGTQRLSLTFFLLSIQVGQVHKSKSRENSGPLYGARGSKIDVAMQALPPCCLVTYCYV